MNHKNQNFMNLFLDLVGQGKDASIELGINMFLNHTKAERSIETFNYYYKHLKVIKNYLDEQGITKFQEVTVSVLDQFVIYSKEIRCNKNITINKRIGALRTVSNYLFDLKILSKPLILTKLKETPKKITILILEELSKVLNYIKNISVRNQVLIELLLQTGVRRTELCTIRTSDVDLVNNRIYLEHTKTNAPRYIFFDDVLKSKIRILLNPKSTYLFTSKGNRFLSPSTLDSIFERMKKRLNIKMLSPHLLRHTFATYILKNGGNLEEVRLLLGHASYQMTQRYLHLLQDELKVTSLKYNPMSSLQ